MTGRRGGLLALGLLLATAPAGAAPRVLVLIEQGDDPVARRLEAELSTLGLEAVLARPPASEAPVHESLLRVSREQGVIAALRLIPTRGVIEVWLADRVTGKTSLREITPTPGEPPELLALRALELLRASLLELRDDPPRGEVPAPPAALALARAEAPAARAQQPPPPPSPYALLLGPAASWSPGGTGVGQQMYLSVRHVERRGVGPELFAAIPVGASRVEGAEGQASIRVLMAGAGFRVSTSLGPLDASVGGGMGYGRLSVEGQAVAPFRAAAESTASLLFHAAAGAHARLSPRFAVGAEALVALASSKHAIVFAGRPVASWGRPTLAAAIVAELRFP